MVVCSVFEITENENPKKGFEQTEDVEKWTRERKRCYKK